MRYFGKITLALVLLTGALYTAGCPERTSIADIEANPSRYQNKDVVIAGTVRDSYVLIATDRADAMLAGSERNRLVRHELRRAFVNL